MNNPCIIPKPVEDTVGDGRWESMHNRFVAEAKHTESEVVFLGDSIIQQLQFSTLWTEKINSLHCVNFGIGGDRVENVLWRILNGELDFGVKIKAVVLFVGTNNTDCTPHEVFEGILEIVGVIKQKLGSETRIILPTLLPRGQFPNPYRERNDHVNTFLLDKFDAQNDPEEITKNVHVVPIHNNIVQGDQSISHHIMHDYLHLSNSGYTKIFTPVHEKLCELLRVRTSAVAATGQGHKKQGEEPKTQGEGPKKPGEGPKKQGEGPKKQGEGPKKGQPDKKDVNSKIL